MISFLALLLAIWATTVAGPRAIEKQKDCMPCDLLDAKWAPLEVKPTAAGLAQILGDGDRATCKAMVMKAGLTADWLFLLSYGTLNLFLFLFLATRVWTKPWLVPVLVIGGVILTVVMVGGDIWENAVLRGWLDGAPPPDAPLRASVVKWLALGVAGALGGVAFLTAPRWWGRIPALAGFASLLFFLWGLRAGSVTLIEKGGMGSILVFWILVLLHAIGASTVALRPLDERSAR